MQRILLCVSAFLWLMTACQQSPQPGNQVLMERKAYFVIDSYWIYLPDQFDPEKSYPLIVYLQGGDMAAGPNPRTVKNDGPAKIALLPNPHHFAKDSFIIINPHMNTGPRHKRQWGQHADELNLILDEISANHNIDDKRIYLTGPSKGGRGTFNILKKIPDRIAASVPIAGRIDCQSGCDAILTEPIWIIHNQGDPLVEVDFAYNVERFFLSQNHTLKKSSNSSLDSAHQRLSILTGETHDAWTHIYQSKAFYQWLLLFQSE
ncbi:MAG: hypothetical protein JXQ90_07560 [Cyclobacteriaceae bacterium]